MVDENILKLEIKRLRDTLSSKADNVFNLEKRKLQLETVSMLRNDTASGQGDCKNSLDSKESEKLDK